MQRWIGRLVVMWLGSMVVLLGAILLGQTRAAPMIEWSSSTLYLRDAYTGVDYQVLRPRTRTNRDDNLTESSLPVSGVQIIASPQRTRSMTVMNVADGLDILVSDADGQTLHAFRSDIETQFLNVIWARDDTLLMLTRRDDDAAMLNLERVTIAAEDTSLLTTQHVGQLRSTAFYVSPDRRWVLSSDWFTGETAQRSTQVINVFTGDTYRIDRRVMNIRWTSNGRYLALHIANGSQHGFLLLDTLTGNRHAEDFTPTHMLWSDDERYLLVASDERVQLFEDAVLLLDRPVPDTIVQVRWSPVDNLAMIFTADNALSLVDAEAGALRSLVALPARVDYATVAWSPDSAYITMMERRAVDHLRILRLDTTTGDLVHIHTIHARVRQARYYEQVTNYPRLP